MPYVPSEKSIPPAVDRKVLDPLIEAVAEKAADAITQNSALAGVYMGVFAEVSGVLVYLLDERWDNVPDNPDEKDLEKLKIIRPDTGPESTAESCLACAIWETGEKYDYEGAFLGELNYALTMFIQKVPAIKVARGDWQEKDELRYWLYARTAEVLQLASWMMFELKAGFGIGGVIDDVLREYKRQMNTAYEAEQILKNGHCYFGPYYTRPVEVVDAYGDHVGYVEVMLKRSEETLHKDILDGQIVLEMKRKKAPGQPRIRPSIVIGM